MMDANESGGADKRDDRNRRSYSRVTATPSRTKPRRTKSSDVTESRSNARCREIWNLIYFSPLSSVSGPHLSGSPGPNRSVVAWAARIELSVFSTASSAAIAQYSPRCRTSPRSSNRERHSRVGGQSLCESPLACTLDRERRRETRGPPPRSYAPGLQLPLGARGRFPRRSGAPEGTPRDRDPQETPPRLHPRNGASDATTRLIHRETDPTPRTPRRRG